MTKIELVPDRSKYLIIVYRDGKAPHRDYFNPGAAKQRIAKARAWGVDPDVFDQWCEETRIHGSSKTFEVAEARGASKADFLVRPMDAADSAGVPHDVDPSRFVKETVPSIPVDHIAKWKDATLLCCLDVDYHASPAPAREWLESVMLTRLTPKPLMWHFSRSGGLHLFYVAAGDFTAEELAAVAALRFRSIDRSAGLELKTVARGPGGEKVNVADFQDTAAGLVEWLGSEEFSETDRDNWLDSEGMECGKRYDHDRCPIDRTPGDLGTNHPVVVSEAGIYCFRCNGKGLTLGSRRPGWAPWPAILGAPSAGELGGLVRNAVHWGHAKWVLTERYDLPLPFAKLAYKAALKAFHAGRSTEASLGLVFDPETDEIARVNNRWTKISSSYSFPAQIQPLLRRLPSANYADADGKLKINEAAVTVLNQTMDLRDRGYRNISVVHGFKLAGQFLGDRWDRTSVAVPNPMLKALSSRALPRYAAASKRMPMDEAWSVLEGVLPRLDRTYITALIVAFGCSQETQSGLLPMLFAAGPSSVGKTAMAQVAAGIIGARIGAEATFNPEPAKFREGIYEGAQEGPVVVLNELLKDATRGMKGKMTVREALDFVLNLTPNSSSHVMYRGPVKMGRLPTLVITDTACPATLRDETQIARRIRYWKISGRKDEWKETIAKAGVTDLHLIRTANDQTARACDAIMSDVIDNYFALPETWDTLADAIGVKTIEQSDNDFEDPTKWLLELFRLVCEAPDLTDREKKLYSNGFKKITRAATGPTEEESSLCQVYSMFADGPGADWASSRRLLEKDWATILKVDNAVHLDLKGDSKAIYLRFRQGPVKSPTAVNAAIADPTLLEKLL